jgi:putative transcriptional regulator
MTDGTLDRRLACWFLSLANLSILKTGNARAIRLTTLAALCSELRCHPGDLLSFEP